MTQHKKLKKAVRARSTKTGESYTAARRQLLAARDKAREAGHAGDAAQLPVPSEPPAAAPAPEPAAASPAAPAARGAIADAAVVKKTGKGLDHWFAVLDAFGAPAQGHTATATHLYEAHGVPGWYAQGITVAYERARGLREVNQSSTGGFQVSVSKTMPAAVAEIAEALESAERRARWLAGADPALAGALDAAFSGAKPREVKTKGNDLAWLRFPWDGTSVEIRVTGKTKGGATVVASNEKLADSAHVELRRAQWRAALEGLLRHLAAEG